MFFEYWRLSRVLCFETKVSDILICCKQASKAKAKAAAKAAAAEEVVSYGPKNVLPNELVFGVARIYASFNDTFVVRAFRNLFVLSGCHKV